MIEFTIPGRPTAWQRHIEFVDKRTHRIVKKTPPDMAAQQRAIQMLCRASMRTMQPLVGAVRLEVLCVYAVPVSWPQWKREAAKAGAVWKCSVPDHDNLVKQISDALNSVAYLDDSQIVRSSMGKRYGSPERTEVRIVPVEGLSDRSAKDAFLEWAAKRDGQDSLPLGSAEASNS